MPDEVSIRIKAIDEASATLREIKDGLVDIDQTAPEASAGLEQVASVSQNQVAPAIESANVPTRAMTQLLRGIGLEGPANMLQLGNSAQQIVAPMLAGAGATGVAAGATNTLTVSVLGLDIALSPVLLILGGILLTLIPIIGAVALFKFNVGLLGGVLGEAFGGTTMWSQALRNLVAPIANLIGRVADLGKSIRENLGAAVARGIVTMIAGAQSAAVGALNSIGSAVTTFYNKALGIINALRTLLGLSALSARTWSPIPLNLSWASANTGSFGKGEKPEGADQNPLWNYFGTGGMYSMPGSSGGITGGGGGSTGGVGGTGVNINNQTPGRIATRPGVSNEVIVSVRLDELQRVRDDQMQELLDALNRLPQATRDAIVTYTGGI